MTTKINSTKSQVPDVGTVVFLGSYDRGKPRVRLMIEGASAVGLTVHECYVDVWGDIEDKSQIRGLLTIFRYVLRWIVVRPVLLFRYCRAPSHESVVIPYPGVFDLLFFYPAIKWRGSKVFLDCFISMYDTVVNDRKLINKHSIMARMLYVFEWMASRVADVVLLDTETHSQYYRNLFQLEAINSDHVAVGVETSTFLRMPYYPWTGEGELNVLFYGQFVPLQGTMTLLEAISLWESAPKFQVRWTIIGKGQEAQQFDQKLVELQLSSVRRIEWVPYAELPELITKSDVCCGIFGDSQKALNVIPNKIYQVLAVGRPLITADTPGVRSLLKPASAIELIRPCDPEAIVSGLHKLSHRILENPGAVKTSVDKMPIIGATEVGTQLTRILQRLPR